MKKLNSLFTMINNVDRRYIYLVLLLSIILSLFTKSYFEDKPSALTLPIYNKIESLEPGIPILISMEYSPTSEPELGPMAVAIAHHAYLSGHPVCYMSLWPEGGVMINRVVDKVYPNYEDALYGEDWANLGFKVGGEMVINSMRGSLSNMFPVDVNGQTISTIPILSKVSSLSDFGLIVSLSGGTPGLKEWILYAGDELDIPVAGGCKGIGAPQYLPYYPEQLIGLFNGLKGASEYESILNHRDTSPEPKLIEATTRMGPQTIAHLVIMLLLVIGNISTLGLAILRRKK